jgi:hypothetical protein
MTERAFSPEQRDRIRDLVLGRARNDDRIAGGAIVGSFATGAADRWSDLDLAFGLAEHVAPGAVLDDWTDWLARDEGAIHLFDLSAGTAVYRVYILPGALQLDVSVRPKEDFRSGPGFELVFGAAADQQPPVPPSTRDLLGWAVVFAIHLRACLERGRLWQAEYDLNELRERAMGLACLRRGLRASYGRGFDELPAEVLARFAEVRASALTDAELCRAAAAGIELLLAEASGVDDRAEVIAADLRGVAGWFRERAEQPAPGTPIV